MDSFPPSEHRIHLPLYSPDPQGSEYRLLHQSSVLESISQRPGSSDMARIPEVVHIEEVGGNQRPL